MRRLCLCRAASREIYMLPLTSICVPVLDSLRLLGSKSPNMAAAARLALHNGTTSASLPSFHASTQFTKAPNPPWKWGDGVLDETWSSETSVEYQSWESKDTPAPALYMLLISAIVPRPIALVSTVNETGLRNLAPFR
jgi:hypothetical protein